MWETAVQSEGGLGHQGLRINGSLHFQVVFFGGGVQTKMSWRSPLTSQYSREPLGIKVQSCPVLR